MKKILALLFIFLSLSPLAACGGGGGAGDYIVPVYADDADKYLFIGAYDPYLGRFGQADFNNPSHFADIAAAGFTVLCPLDDKVNFDVIPESSYTTLERAHEAGLKVLVQDGAISLSKDPSKWADPDDRNVHLYESHPAFIGNHMHDEPVPTLFPRLKKSVSIYKERLPGKLCFINLFQGMVSTGVGAASFKSYLSDFLDITGADFLSYDHYPLLQSGGVRGDYLSDMETAAHVAKSRGVPLHNYLLSIPHTAFAGIYRSPSEEDLRWQVACDLTYGLKGFTYFTYGSFDIYHNDSYGDALVSRYGNKTPLYYYAQKVNNEALAWDHVYLSYEWQNTAFLRGSKKRQSDIIDNLAYSIDASKEKPDGVKSLSSDEDILMGLFKDADGRRGYMLTNAVNPALKCAASVTVGFNGYDGVQVYEKGVPKIYALEKGKISLVLEPGEGKFMIPLKKA